jgi:Tol biopolymer transport system component
MVRGIATALVVGGSLLCASARANDLPFVAANGRIAFAVSTGIASMNPDGSGQWGVELQVGDTQPAWSPDGTRLAVVTHWAGRNGIELLQPNGDALGMLTSETGDAYPSWSPDGRTVAFTDGPEVFLVNADGTGRRQLTNNVGFGYAQRPTWSPDGRTIAYGSYRGSGGQHIYAINVATGKETALTSGSTYDTNPVWSPDGSTILFTSTRDGTSGIFSMHPDGTGVAKAATLDVYADYAAWSPDGKRIAFYGNGEIWVMNADGSGAHPLTNGNDASMPAWQPLNRNTVTGVACTIVGTSANDLLVGTDGNDAICGLGGNDTIIGLGGDDTLLGGSGDDYLAGGTGRNYLSGDDGNDTIDARNGTMNVVTGGSGRDSCLISGPRGTFMSSIERPRVDANLAVWMPANADAFEPTNPPQLAFDGLIQDWWNSGNYPPHWVEVDLQYPRTIGRVQLVAPQLGGDATVLLLGRSAVDQPFRLLHTFKGPFADLQSITVAPKHPWPAVRYLRLEVGSGSAWVSWRELAVYPPAAKKKA